MAKLLSTLTNLLCATAGTFTTIATLAVLLTTVNICEGSSNTASITHRSYSTEHGDDNNVHVIKSEPQRNEEYVTSFYKRVREKHRANFGRQLEESTQRMIEEEESAIRSRNDGDHSLDHYFDHQLNSNHHGSYKKKEEERKPALRAAELTSVRGGGAAATAERRRNGRLVQSPAFVSTDKKGDIWSPRESRNSQKRHSNGRGHSRDFEDEYDLEEEGYDDEVQVEDMFDEGEEYEEQQHHLGLLRVPCSIAVNSGEATHQHHASSNAKTPMATYVDTGAQVTIISASAAKRAGIYHLIDRRYAGRATGVGQCRILGRIPARHVYFLLGEGCDKGGVEQDYDEEDWLEESCPRGGDQEEAINGRGVQMDGPALTVLEGTVTQGVDILLGLDVLQDWDAEIRMGKKKSITVHKRGSSGDSSGVVIPFASSSITAASNRRYTRREDGERGHPSSDTSTRRHHSRSRSTHHRHNKSKAIQDDILSSNFEASDDIQEMETCEEDTDDEDFSPTASDIESDLDWLDQLGHEFPSEEGSYRDGGTSLQDLEDEMLRRSRVGSCNMDEDDEDTDYDSDEDIEDDLFDMAGY